MAPLFRLGTRASPLARAQAALVVEALIATHRLAPDAIEIVPIVASGDQIQDVALADIGGKALWTKELDQALAGGRIDLAVHSMKDVETHRPPHFTLAAILPRGDVCDRLIGCHSVTSLRQNAVVGTSSPRRQAQLLRLRPDLSIVLLRGNVATRIAKVADETVDATLLAAAGLDRLGMANVGTAIPLETLLPAAAQGAIGIEVRANDMRIIPLVAAISHVASFSCVIAERTLLAALGGNCHTAMAALAVCEGSELWLRAELYLPDGSELVRKQTRFAAHDTHAPAALASELLAAASPSLRALFEA